MSAPEQAEITSTFCFSAKKTFIGQNKSIWGPLELVEKLCPESADIATSARDLPSIKYAMPHHFPVNLQHLMLNTCVIIADLMILLLSFQDRFGESKGVAAFSAHAEESSRLYESFAGPQRSPEVSKPEWLCGLNIAGTCSHFTRSFSPCPFNQPPPCLSPS